MIELFNDEMQCLSSFPQEKLDVILQSCIEGNIGRAWVDKKDTPSIAIVVAADFCYFLGCITKDKFPLMIDELLERCGGKIIISNDSSWIRIIESIYPTHLKRFSRFSIKRELNVFQKNLLNSYINAIDTKFHIDKINESLYYKVLKNNLMADCCSNYSSLEEFLKHGIGYAIVHNGEIISAASSYTYCNGNIEITIGTQNEFRRNGLALAVASKLILDCMGQNIYPRWDAANLGSVALAEKLGYHLDKEYEAYSIS